MKVTFQKYKIKELEMINSSLRDCDVRFMLSCKMFWWLCE